MMGQMLSSANKWNFRSLKNSRWAHFYFWVLFSTHLDRYLLRETILPFIIGVLLFVVILTGHFFYQVLSLIINRGAPAKDLLLMLAYLVPPSTALAIPIGVILGTCVAINRLGREMELMALRASGVSVQRIVLPFLAISILVAVGDFFLNDRISPESNHRANQILNRILLINPTPFIEEDKFFKVGSDFYFYVRQINREMNTLNGVLIYRKDPLRWQFPQVITAQWAQKQKNGDLWVLHDVFIHTYEKKGDILAYTKKPIKKMVLDLKEDLQNFWSDYKQTFEMSSLEMRQRIEIFEKSGLDTHSLKVDYHFKFSLPAAASIMTLWAAPLSVHFARTGSFAGLFIAILGVFLYEGAMGWARAIGIKYHLNPFLIAWSQNLLFGLMGLWFLFSIDGFNRQFLLKSLVNVRKTQRT